MLPSLAAVHRGVLDRVPRDNEDESVSTSSSSSAQLQSKIQASDNAQEQQAVRARRRPIPSKGHTKSRKGCLSCKRRKINARKRVHARNSLSFLQPDAAPTSFTGVDMRLFHHFLIKAYPYLPAGADAIWTHEVPSFAHEYDFLLHSILALGASHLSISAPGSPASSLESRALVHKVEAVRCLNRALSNPPEGVTEADARFAAVMILTYQSSCVLDGLYDFMTMLRGCVLASNLGTESLFWCFFAREYINSIEERFSDTQLRKMDTSFLDKAVSSLATLQPLCRKGIESTYLTLLERLFQASYNSLREAYEIFAEMYSILGLISLSDFQALLSRSHKVAQILLCHFLAVHILLRPVTVIESGERNVSPMFNVLAYWVQKIHDDLDPPWQRLNQWPVSFVKGSSPWANLKSASSRA